MMIKRFFLALFFLWGGLNVVHFYGCFTHPGNVFFSHSYTARTCLHRVVRSLP